MNIRILFFVTLAVALAACSSSPDRNSVSDRDLQLPSLAPSAIERAGSLLHVGEPDWTDGDTLLAMDGPALSAGQSAVVVQENVIPDGRIHAGSGNTQVDHFKNQSSPLDATDATRGTIVTVVDVMFDRGQSRLSAASVRNMVKLAEFFKRNPQREASIEGYTDNVGAADANFELSDLRAKAVMTMLLSLDVPPDHLRTLARGAADPAADNRTAAGRQMNRRVEIVFVPHDEHLSMR